jgi:hypothetical protein
MHALLRMIKIGHNIQVSSKDSQVKTQLDVFWLVNLYSLLVYIEHNRDESPKDKKLELWQIVCKKYNFNINAFVGFIAMNVGPCHHGMARPLVADGGTASNMERSCE